MVVGSLVRVSTEGTSWTTGSNIRVLAGLRPGRPEPRVRGRGSWPRPRGLEGGQGRGSLGRLERDKQTGGTE